MRLSKALFIIATSLSFKICLAGVVNGGGGKGILCGQSLVTLDLFEAQLKGYKDPVTTNSLEGDLKKYGPDLMLHFAYSVSNTYQPGVPNTDLANAIFGHLYKSIISKFVDIESGTRLPLTNDATVPALPEGCKVVQIATYLYDEDIIQRDSQYWQMLKPIDQAALVAHEWVYHRAKEYGILKSDETRQLIGKLFSEEKVEPNLSPIWYAKSRMFCGAGRYKTDEEIFEFYGVEEIREGIQGLALYFAGFKSAYVTSRTSAFLPRETLQQFINPEPPGVINIVVKNSVTDESTNFEITYQEKAEPRLRMRAQNSDGSLPVYSNGFCKIE